MEVKEEDGTGAGQGKGEAGKGAKSQRGKDGKERGRELGQWSATPTIKTQTPLMKLTGDWSNVWHEIVTEE